MAETHIDRKSGSACIEADEGLRAGFLLKSMVDDAASYAYVLCAPISAID